MNTRMNFKNPNATMQDYYPLTNKRSKKVISTPPLAPRHTRRLFRLASKNITHEHDENKNKKMTPTRLP